MIDIFLVDKIGDFIKTKVCITYQISLTKKLKDIFWQLVFDKNTVKKSFVKNICQSFMSGIFCKKNNFRKEVVYEIMELFSREK